MGGEEDDGGYSALALSVQRKIDDAFGSAILSSSPSSSRPPSPKRRKIHRDHASPRPPSTLSVDQPGTVSNEPPPGGFLLDDPSPGGFLRDDSPPPGGFLPEPSQHSDTDQDDVPTHIPLSLIPTALQTLNLQPDDDDVLSVFRNAASGWNHRPTSHHPQDGLVSRRDWRAVCAALLDPGLARDNVNVDAASSSTSDALVGNMDRPSDSGEEYVQSIESDSDKNDDQDSDDDYHEGGFLRSKRPARKTTSNAVSASTRTGRGGGLQPGALSSEDGSEIGKTQDTLTAHQKKECRAAFAFFFLDARDETLEKARIRIKDVTRVAALIKEKVSSEEVVEMLEAFTSSPDKSMGLGDFELMMVAAKMV
ncbi:hypothetical protein LXA43DRAFT_1001354 [Ganoderma leucocontextum]|nr:hypothetical protein LXA43DRAFT_1001354 [Ganoderma leucocontextum]